MPRQKAQHLKRQKDGRYYCKFRGVMFSGTTEQEALQKRTEYKIRLQRESAIRINPTVTEYAEIWFPMVKTNAPVMTYNAGLAHLKHLTKCIGDMLIADVRPSDIKRVYSTCYLDASNAYIKQAKSTFSAMFRAAVDDGIIATNPVIADAAKPHRGPEGSHRAITDDERWAIENLATDHPMHIAAIIMLYAGLRPQEVKALRLDEIDTEIHVRSFVHKTEINKYVVTPIGKTKKATRTVPLFPPVRKAIQGKSGYILSRNGDVALPSTWRDSWKDYRAQIETELNGVCKRWYGRTNAHKKLLAEGKLPPWRTFDVTPYDLRHSFASWCRDNGVELHTVVDWMGHVDATMILQIYDEVSNSRSKKEAERLEKIAFGLQKGLQDVEQSPETAGNTESKKT